MFAVNQDVRYVGNNPMWAGFTGIIECVHKAGDVTLAYGVHSFENYGEIVPFFAEELATI